MEIQFPLKYFPHLFELHFSCLLSMEKMQKLVFLVRSSLLYSSARTCHSYSYCICSIYDRYTTIPMGIEIMDERIHKHSIPQSECNCIFYSIPMKIAQFTPFNMENTMHENEQSIYYDSIYGVLSLLILIGYIVSVIAFYIRPYQKKAKYIMLVIPVVFIFMTMIMCVGCQLLLYICASIDDIYIDLLSLCWIYCQFFILFL